VAPTRLQNSLQKTEINCGPRTDTTSAGRPCRQNTCSSINWAVSLAVGNLGKGTKCAILLKRSTTVRMTVWPWEGGMSVTKSNEMWDQG